MASEAVPSAPRRAPVRQIGWMMWIRENLFNSWFNSLLTLLIALLVVQVVSNFVGWFFTTQGWTAVLANLRLIMVFRYPVEAIWRVQTGVWIVAFLLGLSAGTWKGTLRLLAGGLATLFAMAIFLPLAAPPSGANYHIVPELFLVLGIAMIGAGYALGLRYPAQRRWLLVLLWVLAFPFITIVLLHGVQPEGAQPFGTVPTTVWGGFMLTIVLAAVGILASFPLGILLALGRRSNLPIVKTFCTVYIEVIRGVPLITVLFMGQFLLPLFLPEQVRFGDTVIPMRIDNLVRAMVAVTLFSAAYLAENVRGGLQSIPKGQTEAAQALGLNYVHTTLFITLPQALRAVIPALVGQSISLFKDTSLVTIIGLFDLLNVAQKVVPTQPAWLGIPGGVWRETLFFAAVIYFIFAFTMSRISLRIERNLGVGRR